MWLSVFFFNDTATTEIYTLSLHDALPILPSALACVRQHVKKRGLSDPPLPIEHQMLLLVLKGRDHVLQQLRSEEHTSELQSRQYLVCRLLLEKKKTTIPIHVLLTFLLTLY